MAYLRADSHSVPITFPLGVDGCAMISSTTLSLRFQYREESLHVEEEIFDDISGELSHAVGQLSTQKEFGTFWLLKPGKYRVYGITESVLGASTELLTPRSSTTVCINSDPPLRKVKTEPGLQTIFELSDSDSENVLETTVLPEVKDTTLPTADEIPAIVVTSLKSSVPCTPAVSPPSIPAVSPSNSVVQCLMKLSARKRSKSVLSRINFDAIRMQEVEYLPPQYNGDVIFEFPPLGAHGHHSGAKQLRGMDRKYDGHPWTRTATSNIQNDLKLTFRSSSCLGHLRCDNVKCEYLTRDNRTSVLNETEWDGKSEKLFEVGSKPPQSSTVVCKSCSTPPTCVALCPAKIYYVTAGPHMTRACVHFGTHNHPVKSGENRDFVEHTENLIREQVERTPSATPSAIVLETAKELLGPLLLAKEGEPQKILELEELEPIFDRCKHLSSPNIRNCITSFKNVRRFGTMDGIRMLRGFSNWKFIQNNMFPGQGDDAAKVYVFKMSEVGPGSGVDLVKRMQTGGDLEDAWIMFDHVRRVRDWVTMACHVYDPTYCRIMTIAACDMQSEDTAAQSVLWKNLNAIMETHGVARVNFKGFMADGAQANWNAVRIIYGSGNASERMVDRERTCLFHWRQSLEQHTNANIRQDLRAQHIKLCQQYKNATTLAEAETKFLAIRAWWMSSGAATGKGLSNMETWLSFWHHRYRQWGGFMELVSYLSAFQVSIAS